MNQKFCSVCHRPDFACRGHAPGARDTSPNEGLLFIGFFAWIIAAGALVFWITAAVSVASVSASALGGFGIAALFNNPPWKWR